MISRAAARCAVGLGIVCARLASDFSFGLRTYRSFLFAARSAYEAGAPMPASHVASCMTLDYIASDSPYTSSSVIDCDILGLAPATGAERKSEVPGRASQAFPPPGKYIEARAARGRQYSRIRQPSTTSATNGVRAGWRQSPKGRLIDGACWSMATAVLGADSCLSAPSVCHCRTGSAPAAGPRLIGGARAHGLTRQAGAVYGDRLSGGGRSQLQYLAIARR